MWSSGLWRWSHVTEVTALHLAAPVGLAKVALLRVKESDDVEAVGYSVKPTFEAAIE